MANMLNILSVIAVAALVYELINWKQLPVLQRMVPSVLRLNLLDPLRAQERVHTCDRLAVRVLYMMFSAATAQQIVVRSSGMSHAEFLRKVRGSLVGS